MADMREYKETIKAAVARERDADENWSWGVKAINKGIAKISWGYLDYIGEKEFFTVEVTEDEAFTSVVGTIPNGSKKYSFIGPDRWDDAKTIDEGIRQVIHAIALSAHNTY